MSSAGESIPAATVLKVVEEVMPDGTRLSNDAKNLVATCCIEFINLVASEAHEISEKEKKKTVAPEHVVQAVQALGFGQLAPRVETAANAWTNEDRTALESKKKKRKDKQGGMSDEQAILEQERLFKEAAAELNSGEMMIAMV